jgi:hypothetical protein
MKLHTGILGSVFAAGCATVGSAQLVPVVGRGATAFDPEISVVNAGAVLDAQAVVSADRRYVTITMVPQNASIIALRPFPVQGVAGGGVVGGANPGGDANGTGGRAAPGGTGTQPQRGDEDTPGFSANEFPVITQPSQADLKDPAILNRRGMIRLRSS